MGGRDPSEWVVAIAGMRSMVEQGFNHGKLKDGSRR
jgi:hypothetical protein